MRQRIVMEGRQAWCQEVWVDGLKYSSSLPLSFLRPSSAFLKQPTLNESMTGQKSQGWVKTTNQLVQKRHIQLYSAVLMLVSKYFFVSCHYCSEQKSFVAKWDICGSDWTFQIRTRFEERLKKWKQIIPSGGEPTSLTTRWENDTTLKFSFLVS